MCSKCINNLRITIDYGYDEECIWAAYYQTNGNLIWYYSHEHKTLGVINTDKVRKVSFKGGDNV